MLGCARVFSPLRTDLARRHSNAAPKSRLRNMAFALEHLQRTDPKGFHVAEKGGRVAAFASTILRATRTSFPCLGVTVPAEARVLDGGC